MRRSVCRRSALFPHLAPNDGKRIAASIGALSERNEVFVRNLKRSGTDAVRPLLEIPDAFAALGGRCILITFHVGAVHAIGLALESLGRPVLALREGKLVPLRPPVVSCSTRGNDVARAAVFLRAVDSLKRGDIVCLAVDLTPGAPLQTTCLGRPLPLARGAFALARVTGARVVPVVARWTPNGMRLVVGDALEGSTEASLADAAARWLDDYLRESPEQVTLGLLRELLARSAV